MEYKRCITCGIQYKKSNDYNNKFTNRYLAASREYYQQKY